MSVKINSRITLLDSMSFLSGGLESLFDSIKDTCELNFLRQSSLLSEYNKVNGKRQARKDSTDRVKLLVMKGVFPYEYSNTLEDFERPSLVEKTDVHNSMTVRGITDDQYKRAQTVWKTFQMTTTREYMETYSLSDTLLLCEVFERFKNESMINFGIEPGHFLSLPGFAYQAFLKLLVLNWIM